MRRTDKWSLTGQMSDFRGKLKRVNALAAGFKRLGRVGLGIELIPPRYDLKFPNLQLREPMEQTDSHITIGLVTILDSLNGT